MPVSLFHSNCKITLHKEITLADMGEVVREMKLPFYWKEPLFRACGGKPGLVLEMKKSDPYGST